MGFARAAAGGGVQGSVVASIPQETSSQDNPSSDAIRPSPIARFPRQFCSIILQPDSLANFTREDPPLGVGSSAAFHPELALFPLACNFRQMAFAISSPATRWPSEFQWPAQGTAFSNP
jgi:hypothetical protein